ncbi:putative hydro-lyase KRH_21160 isoform X2 [Panicum virgatum]|uniref:putative hydro-lyase KRH_21160 isoform X2 n=1 Tax=Panicum virgatum TaxID=38727 RepID=UPI0019D51DE0|nr:putative hydro-lyase KRH_21160 isoform X2 [Panicum virgatum]
MESLSLEHKTASRPAPFSESTACHVARKSNDHWIGPSNGHGSGRARELQAPPPSSCPSSSAAVPRTGHRGSDRRLGSCAGYQAGRGLRPPARPPSPARATGHAGPPVPPRRAKLGHRGGRERRRLDPRRAWRICGGRPSAPSSPLLPRPPMVAAAAAGSGRSKLRRRAVGRRLPSRRRACRRWRRMARCWTAARQHLQLPCPPPAPSCSLLLALIRSNGHKGYDISNPDLFSMKDALATAKPQPSDHQPPLPNEGARTISNKVYSEVHPNEIFCWETI